MNAESLRAGRVGHSKRNTMWMRGDPVRRGGVRNIFHLKAFHFETLDILSCVSTFRNPSGNPIYQGHTYYRHTRDERTTEFNLIPPLYRILLHVFFFNVFALSLFYFFKYKRLTSNYLILSVVFGHRFLLCLPLALVSVILKPDFHLQHQQRFLIIR